MRKVDNLVIGSTLEAVRYAHKHDYYILLTDFQEYFFFDFGLEGKRREILIGLYISGKVLNHTPVHQVTIEGDILSYFNGYEEKTIAFKDLCVFDFVNIVADGFRVVDEGYVYRVLDWVLFLSGGGSHSHDYFFVGDRDFYEVHFYQTKRHQVKSFKDAVVVSYLTKEEESDPDYGHAITRLKMGQVIEGLGVMGRTKRGVRQEAMFEVGDRQVTRVAEYRVETPDSIRFYNSYMNEVLNGEVKALLITERVLPSWSNSHSKTAI